MADQTFLSWPFFEDRHREYIKHLESWASNKVTNVDHSDTDAACLALVKSLGKDGWLQSTAAQGQEKLDVRTLCLSRETLARYDSLADFAFAMQGLGTGAISIFGTTKQQEVRRDH